MKTNKTPEGVAREVELLEEIRTHIDKILSEGTMIKDTKGMVKPHPSLLVATELIEEEY